MKPPPTTLSKPAGGAQGAAAVARDDALPKFGELGFVERRRVGRTLPVPLAVESNGDTDWATFQALLSDPPPN